MTDSSPTKRPAWRKIVRTSLSRSTNTQPTLSLKIYLLSRDQLQTSEQCRVFPRQWFLIRPSLHSEAEQKLLTWEDDNRSSIQQSDTSYMNIKHFNCYVTIYLNVYLIFIYLFTCLFLFSLYVHIFSSSCIHVIVYIDLILHCTISVNFWLFILLHELLGGK